MDFLYIKALHIIFVITWFAGLFYIVRLFIYHKEAEKRLEPAKEILQTQFKTMSKRLWYIITWPSAILATFFAGWMLYTTPVYLTMPWMHVKLTFVVALFFYHFSCQRMYNQLQKGSIKYSAFKLRMFNEIATIILFAVIFIVTLKDTMNWIWGVAGIIILGIILMLSIKLYKNVRAKKSWDKYEKEMVKEVKNEQQVLDKNDTDKNLLEEKQ